MVQIVKGLRRRKRGYSLRAIAADLAARGYVNVNGREYSAASVASMLGGRAHMANTEATFLAQRLGLRGATSASAATPAA